MALSFANEGASSGTPTAPDLINAQNNQTSVASASWTPDTTKDVILVIVTYRIGTTAPTSVSLSGNGVTWTQLAFINDGAVAGMALFAAPAASATAGATTVTYDNSTKGTLMGFGYADGVDLSGGVAAAFIQAVTGSGGSSPASLTLSAAGATDNRPFAAFDHYSDEGTTAQSGWTELDDFSGLVVNSQPRSISSQYRTDQFDTAAGASWATTTENWCGCAVELKAAAGGGGPATKFFPVIVGI